jgi:3-oxoacyl-(acyl-carrier-protein) synthase/acyl carrier protein
MHDVIDFDVTQPAVRDHTVAGQHVLPGLAYIDLVFQLFADRGHDPRDLSLRNLKIYAPLIVDVGASSVCRVDIDERRAGVWDVAVKAHGPESPSRGTAAEATCYASVEMHRQVEDEFTEQIEPAALRRSATRVIGADQLYDRCRQQQLVHGEFMRADGTVFSTADATYAAIAVSARGTADADRLLFHPALIDGAAVLLGASIEGAQGPAAGELVLPLSCERFEAAGPLGTACVARLRHASVKRTGDVCLYSLEFFDAEGRKAATLQNLASKVVRGHLVRPGRGPSSDMVAADYELQLRPLVADALGVSQDAIDPNEGFFHLGLSSAALLGLVGRIERLTGRALPPTLLFEHSTLRAVAAHLAGVDEPVAAPSPPAAAPRSDRPASDAVDNRRIAVIGMAGRYPGAADVDQLWRNLRAGTDAVTEVPVERWAHAEYFDPAKAQPGKAYGRFGGFIEGIDGFDAAFFNVSPAQASLTDPQQRLFLETAWTLLEEAGYTRQRLAQREGGQVGVYVGTMYDDYGPLARQVDGGEVTASSSAAAIANRVSYYFGFTGPSLAVDTMCASSATAVHLACMALTAGECRLAIAGGVNLTLHPRKFVDLSQNLLLASRPDRRSFADGDGFLPAEGVGAVLLKPLPQAIADGDMILAVITGHASRHSGRTAGFAVPNVTAQSQAAAAALRAAGTEARTVSYVEAAASGSGMVDAMEVAGLDKVFSEHTSDRGFCAIGSVKSSIGHAEAASGISQLTKVILQLQHAELVPVIYADPPNPDIAFEQTAFYLPRGTVRWEQPVLDSAVGPHIYPRRALINSSAAGGSSVALVVEEWASGLASAPARHEPQLIVLSARSQDRLPIAVGQLLRHVEAEAGLRLVDIAYTLQVGREAMAWRLAMVVDTRDELISQLAAHANTANGDATTAAPPPWFAGRATNDQPWIHRVFAGTTGAAMVRLLVREREFERLAAMWVHGIDIPWDQLHADDGARIVRLPTYAFARQPYWIGMTSCASTTDAAAEVVAPRTDLERTLAEVWEDVLGVRDIGATTRFFDAGGNSLAAVRVINQLREIFEVEIPIAGLLGANPTIAALAVQVVALLACCDAAPVDADSGIEPVELNLTQLA